MSRIDEHPVFADGQIDYFEIIERAHRQRAEAVAKMYQAVAGWFRRHLSFDAWHHDPSIDRLYEMTDRDLADLALSRCDIEGIEDGTYEDGHGRMPPPRVRPESRPTIH